MKISWKREAALLGIVGATVGAVAASWSKIPERVPVHWNLAGEPDRYGTRVEGFLVLPWVSLLVYVLMRLGPLADPKRGAYERFAGTYDLIRAAVLLLLAGLEFSALAPYLGVDLSVGRVAPLLLGLLFVVLGIGMRGIRPNWLMGIRTPWTLSSPLVWERTHRLGGWLFVLSGLLTMVIAASNKAYGLATALVSLLLAALVAGLFSYVLWRRTR